MENDFLINKRKKIEEKVLFLFSDNTGQNIYEMEPLQSFNKQFCDQYGPEVWTDIGHLDQFSQKFARISTSVTLFKTMWQTPSEFAVSETFWIYVIIDTRKEVGELLNLVMCIYFLIMTITGQNISFTYEM